MDHAFEAETNHLWWVLFFCSVRVFPFLGLWDYVILPDPSTPAYSPCPGARGLAGATALPGLRKCTLDPTPIFLRVPQHGMNAQCLRFVLFEISGQK